MESRSKALLQKPGPVQASRLAAKLFAWFPSVPSDEETIEQWARDFTKYPELALERAIDAFRRVSRVLKWSTFQPYLKDEITKVRVEARIQIPAQVDSGPPATLADVKMMTAAVFSAIDNLEKAQGIITDLTGDSPDPDEIDTQAAEDELSAFHEGGKVTGTGLAEIEDCGRVSRETLCWTHKCQGQPVLVQPASHVGEQETWHCHECRHTTWRPIPTTEQHHEESTETPEGSVPSSDDGIQTRG